MAACRYGISLLVFSLIFHEERSERVRYDIKLNTRRKIPYLRAPIYYPLFLTYHASFQTDRSNNSLFSGRTLGQQRKGIIVRSGPTYLVKEASVQVAYYLVLYCPKVSGFSSVVAMNLRRNPPELCTEMSYIILQTCVRLF